MGGDAHRSYLSYNDDDQLHLDYHSLTSQINQLTWSKAVHSRDDSHPLEVGEALFLWQGPAFCSVQRAGRSEDVPAHLVEVLEGQGDCARLQRRLDEGRRNCQGQSRKRAEEAALYGVVRACSVVGQGFNQLHPPPQARRVRSLESQKRGSTAAPIGPASGR